MNIFCETDSPPSERDTITNSNSSSRRHASMLIELLMKANQMNQSSGGGMSGVDAGVHQEESRRDTTSHPKTCHQDSSSLAEPVWPSSKQHCYSLNYDERKSLSSSSSSSSSPPMAKIVPSVPLLSPPDHSPIENKKAFRSREGATYPYNGWSAVPDGDENSTIDTTDAQQHSVSPVEPVDARIAMPDATISSPLQPVAATTSKGRKSTAQQSHQLFNFGKCKVCKDKATGIHYGIPSCEGCKGFFKRSLTKNAGYVCFYGDKCAMTPKQRKRCKSCRWKSCLEAGMSFNGIKMGRIPKRLKEKATASVAARHDENDDQCSDISDEATSNNSPSAGGPSEETSMADLEEKLFKMKRSMNSLSLCTLEDVLDNIDVAEVKKSRLHSNNLNLLSNNSNNSALLTIRNLIRASTTKIISKCDPSGLMAKTSYNRLFFDTTFENDLVVLNLLRDRLYQLYGEMMSHYQLEGEQAIQMSKQKYTRPMPPACQLIKSHMKRMTQDFKNVFNYLSRLPGIDSFAKSDIECIMKENVMSIYSILRHNIWVDDEIYVILPGNVFFNRQTLKLIMGDEVERDVTEVHRSIIRLDMTKSELCVLIPYIVTIGLECWLPAHHEVILKFNELYKRALLNELSLNKRNQDYLDDVAILVRRMQALNMKLKATNIYAKLDDCECSLHTRSSL